MRNLLETVAGAGVEGGQTRLPKPNLHKRGSQVVSAWATLLDLAPLLRAKTRLS